MPKIQHVLFVNAVAFATAHAALFADFNTPGFRGDEGSASARWENFVVAVGDPGNAPSGVASGGISLSDATLTQRTPGAFVTGSGNIYHAGAASSFDIVDNAMYAAGVGTIVFQLNSLGTLPDFDSVRLEYSLGEGVVSLTAEPALIYSQPLGGFGGDDVIHEWVWNVSDPGVQEYSILWDAAGAHMSVSKATLDTLEFTPVPEPAEYASMTVAGLLGLVLWRRRKGCQHGPRN